MKRRLRWWFRLPPGIRGKLLIDYLRWPITVAAAVLFAYAITLVMIGRAGNLSLDIVFSAGQVFTGLAGIGVAVVAIAGIAKQFERPSATLTVSADRPIHPLVVGLVEITIFNEGDAPAYGLSVSFASQPLASIDELVVPKTNGWRVAVTDDSGMAIFRAAAPLQPGDQLLLTMKADYHLTITGFVSWHGGKAVEFTVPSLQPQSGK